jgi:hypothetical protein
VVGRFCEYENRSADLVTEFERVEGVRLFGGEEDRRFDGGEKDDEERLDGAEKEGDGRFGGEKRLEDGERLDED